MTPQESTMLNDLVRKIQATQLPEKDEEAEQFLKESLGGNPDSLYILAQTVLVQNIGLNQAKAQVQQLQQQLQEAHSQNQVAPPAPAQHTSFMGSLLGRHDPPPPPPQNFPPRPAAPPQNYPPAASYPPPPPYVPDYASAPPVAPGGGSSFLRSAATTAAGVAAGALAFEGVESILHGFGHGAGGFGGGFGGGGFGERPVEETVINNNYYDDPGQNFGEHHEREASFDERPGSGFGNDERGMQLHDASYETPEEPAYSDPQGVDTLDDDQTAGGLDDTSSMDDSGSFDSGDDSSVI